MSTEAMSIFDRGGSSGNSIICRPSEVSPPVSSRAPSTHNWNMEFSMLSCVRGREGVFVHVCVCEREEETVCCECLRNV